MFLVLSRVFGSDSFFVRSSLVLFYTVLVLTWLITSSLRLQRFRGMASPISIFNWHNQGTDWRQIGLLVSPSDPSLNLASTAAKSPFVIAIKVSIALCSGLIPFHEKYDKSLQDNEYSWKIKVDWLANRMLEYRSYRLSSMQPFLAVPGPLVALIFSYHLELCTALLLAVMPPKFSWKLERMDYLGLASFSAALSLCSRSWRLPRVKQALYSATVRIHPPSCSFQYLHALRKIEN